MTDATVADATGELRMSAFQLIEAAIPTQPMLAEAQSLLSGLFGIRPTMLPFAMIEGIVVAGATAPVVLNRKPVSTRASARAPGTRGLPRTRAFLKAAAELHGGAIQNASFVQFAPVHAIFPSGEQKSGPARLNRFHLLLEAPQPCQFRSREAYIEARHGELWRLDREAPYLCLHGNRADAVHLVFDLVIGAASRRLRAA